MTMYPPGSYPFNGQSKAYVRPEQPYTHGIKLRTRTLSPWPLVPSQLRHSHGSTPRKRRTSSMRVNVNVSVTGAIGSQLTESVFTRNTRIDRLGFLPRLSRCCISGEQGESVPMLLAHGVVTRKYGVREGDWVDLTFRGYGVSEIRSCHVRSPCVNSCSR